MAQFDQPDIASDSIANVYSQYRDRYVPEEGEMPDPTKQNNLPEFLRFNLGEMGQYSPNDIADQAYQHLIDAFDIDKSTGTDLDNIGAILGQPRPYQQQACFMTWNYDSNFETQITGTPWGGFVDPNNPMDPAPNCPWFFQNDPDNTEGSVSDPTYRRALHCVAFKYFSDVNVAGVITPSWNIATLTSMVQTIFILLKKDGRPDLSPTSVDLTQDTTNPLEWTVMVNDLGGQADMADKTLINFINPDRTMIWSRMAGAVINLPQFLEDE